MSNKYDKILDEYREEDGGSGGVSIGDTIGGTPANGGVLYADSSDALKADLWTVGSSSYFAGAVVGKTLGVQGITDSPRFEVLDLSGVGSPAAMAMATSSDPFSFYMTDTDTLTSFFAITINPGTRASSFFSLALLNGTTGTPELYINTTGAQLNVPLDMNSSKITELGTPTTSTDAATKAYVDAVIPSQTGNSGKYLTTDGSAVSWGTVSASPGGSNTQVQYNDSGVLGGESTFTYDETNNRLTVTGGYRMSAGSSNYIGDTDGNGAIWFDGNAANIYGYGMVGFRDGSGEYLNMTRTRFTHGSRGPNNDPLGGGNYDAGAQLNEDVSAYAGKGFGSVLAPRVTATANDDIIAAQYVNPEMRELSYTGVTKIAQIVAPHNSGHNTIRQRLYASSAQNVDMTQWVDSSAAVMTAIAKNGAIKPASLADSAAENNTVYYSTTASKLVYKDGSSNVNPLY